MAKHQWKYNKHASITEQLNDMYSRKNEDYDDSFGKTFKKLGIVSALTRMEDKFNRICSLSLKEDREVQDEAIEDTLMDLANYCIMTLIELQDEAVSTDGLPVNWVGPTNEAKDDAYPTCPKCSCDLDEYGWEEKQFNNCPECGQRIQTTGEEVLSWGK